MSDKYDFFNPDVQDVQIPDTNVTRPISPLRANNAGEYIGQGLGQALKDTGEIVKDAQKLTDYTNKEELSNRIHSTVDPERDAFTASQFAQGDLAGVRAEASSSDVAAANAAAGKANPAAPGAPTGIADVQKKVSAAKAMKEQGTQSEMYYRGRINQLAKEYRQAYPQYRDYIDHIFSKAGFGNPANEYLSAIQRHNAALAAAGAAGDDKDLDKTRSDLHEHQATIDAFYGPGTSAAYASQMAAGKVSWPQVMSKVGTALAAKQNQDNNIHNSGIESKDQAERVTQNLGVDVAKKVGLAMQAPDMQAIVERWAAPPGTQDPKQAIVDAATIRQRMVQIEQSMDADYGRLVPGQRADQFGRLRDTGKMVSPKVIAGADYKPAIDRQLSVMEAMAKALDSGNTSQAGMYAAFAKAKVDTANHLILNQTGVFGDTIAIGDALTQHSPAWAADFYRDVAVKGKLNVPANLQGLFSAVTLGMADGRSFQGMVNAMGVVGSSNGDLNHSAWQLGVQHMQKAPQGPDRDGFIRSLYSSSPSIGDTVKSASDRKDFIGRFAAMTSEDSVRAIKTADPKVQEQAETWIFHEGSNRIAAPLLQTLNKLEAEQGKSLTSQYKIHYNMATHDFGIDAFGFENIRTSDFARIAQSPSVAPLRSAIANVLQTVIDPLNVVTHGYANILKEQKPERINSFIISEMRKAGYTGQ